MKEIALFEKRGMLEIIYVMASSNTKYWIKTRLYKRCLCSQSAFYSALKQLKTMGLIEEVFQEGVSTHALITLTDKGYDLVPAIRQLAEASQY